MQWILLATCAALPLCGCGKPAQVVQCPDLAAVTPASIDPALVGGLTARLAGPDRENTITEAVAEIHARDRSLDADAITDILIAADCPNDLARPDHDIAAVRDRTAAFRAEVDQILGNTGTQ